MWNVCQKDDNEKSVLFHVIVFLLVYEWKSYMHLLFYGLWKKP